MRVLITGGAGFIGSHLAEALMVNPNNEILIVDNLITGRYENIPVAPNVRFIQGSIACAAFTSACFQSFPDIDLICHFAASYADPTALLEDTHTNIIGAINLITNAKKFNVGKIIYMQTALCYGLKPYESPISNTQAYFGGTYEGGSSYAISKTGGELVISNSGIPFLSFRLCNMFGERNLSGALPTFYKNISEGNPIKIVDARRDFLYVKNLIELLMKAIPSDKTGFYNVSSGGDYSIKEIYNILLEVTGMPAPKDVMIIPTGDDDVKTILLDSSKTMADFDWKPNYMDLKSNVHAAAHWYKIHGVKQSFTHLNLK